MRKVLALILAGGAGERLSVLCESRAKPMLRFGGTYRMIDFTLSNCVNSAIYQVGVVAQYIPRSLIQHIGTGQPWDLDRMTGGIDVLQPHADRKGYEWYRGTADAVYRNLFFVEEKQPEQVLVLAGDHIYRARYDEMVAFHQFNKADVTVGITEVPEAESGRFGIVALDEDDRIVEFQEKPARPRSNMASMGIYVFNTEVLISRLREDACRDSSHDFGRDILPRMVASGDRVFGYPFDGYWRDVGTLEAYWAANMDLVVELPPFNLYDLEGPIYTRTELWPPAKTGPCASVTRSLISAGCIINGTVRSSVLSPAVYVEAGAVVEDSVLFGRVFVGRDARIHRAIIDGGANIGPGARVGFGDNYTPNYEEPQNLNTGLTIVGRETRVPAGVTIGRNCKVALGVTEEDFPSAFIASGETVDKKDKDPIQLELLRWHGIQEATESDKEELLRAS